MTDSKKTLRDRVRDMTEEQMVRQHQIAMAWHHAIWDEVSERLDKLAGDDRTGRHAQGAAEARMIRDSGHVAHHQADKFAAVYGMVNVARSGER